MQGFIYEDPSVGPCAMRWSPVPVTDAPGQGPAAEQIPPAAVVDRARTARRARQQPGPSAQVRRVFTRMMLPLASGDALHSDP